MLVTGQNVPKLTASVRHLAFGATSADGFTKTAKAVDHFQIRLPGFEHSPEWAKAMQQAVNNSVAILNGDEELAFEIITNPENVTLFTLMKEKGLNFEEAASNLFKKPPTAKALCDYVIGNAHLQYMKTTPYYRSVNNAFGGETMTTCHFGIPREVESGFSTEFWVPSADNPYAHYTQRARAHLNSNHNKDGHMVAKLSRLERNAADQLVYKNPDAAEILLNQTTHNSWLPMDEEHLERVWTHIDDIFQDLLKLKKARKSDPKALGDVLDKTAELQWWFFQAMPYCRGSAAVGDVFSKVIYKKLGIVVPPYKMGVGPDLEAYVEPLHNFVNNYPNLFDGKIKLAN